MDVSELAKILADDVKREADVGSMLRAVRQCERSSDSDVGDHRKPTWVSVLTGGG